MRISSNAIFRYRGKDRKIFKQNKNYIGYINDHHIIPKQHKNHPIVTKTNYDINGNFNLFIMPIKPAISHFNLNPNIMIHKSHMKYNKYVKEILDDIYSKSNCIEYYEYNLWLFVNYLKSNLKYNKDNIPWN